MCKQIKLSYKAAILLSKAYEAKSPMDTFVAQLANSSEYKQAFTELYEAGLVCRWWCTITEWGKVVVEES